MAKVIKRGKGRPKALTHMNARIQLVLPPDLKDKVQAEAQSNSLGVNAYIRMVLSREVKAH